MKYAIVAEYSTSSCTTVEFPEGKTWADVSEWYIKWHKLNVLFNGETEFQEFKLNDDYETEPIRPSNSKIRAVLEDDEIDWDNDPLAAV